MKQLVVAMIGLMVFVWSGCKDDDTTQPPTGQAQIRMNMVDAPSAFDEVNIVITKIEVRKASPDTGWVTISSASNTFNVLSLRNGSVAVIGNAAVAAGTYSQIRMLFGSNCNVVVSGVPVTLTLAGSVQNGVILDQQINAQANGTYEVTLDFNVGQSIVATGVGQFTLNPVFRVQNNDVAGNVSGTVQPVGAQTSVWTISGTDTLVAEADLVTGQFELVAVPQGIYTVHFHPAALTFRDTTRTSVVVNARQTTSVDTVVVPQ